MKFGNVSFSKELGKLDKDAFKKHWDESGFSCKVDEEWEVVYNALSGKKEPAKKTVSKK